MFNVIDKATGAALGGFGSLDDALTFTDKMATGGDYTGYLVADDNGEVLVAWEFGSWAFDPSAVCYADRKGNTIRHAFGQYLLKTTAYGAPAVFGINDGNLRNALERADGILARISGESKPEFVSVADAAGILGLSKQRVYQMLTEGKLQGATFGSVKLVDRQSVEQASSK